MKPQQYRKKGARFERYIAKEIEAEGLGKAGREAMSGAGFRKGDIASNLPFLIEAKNQKRLNWYESIDQAKKQAQEGNYDSQKWALVTRDPRYPEFQEVYATIDFWQFLKLLKKDSAPLTKEPDREMKTKLFQLKTICNWLDKRL